MNEPEASKEPSAPPTSAPEGSADTQPFIASFQGLWARIKQHKVVQWTLAYLAIAYTLLHGAEMLAGTLNWSHGLLRVFTLVLILGVPVIITLAWYHGARGQQRVSGTEIMIIAILLALGGAFLWRDSGQDHGTEQAAATSSIPTVSTSPVPVISDKTIAVLPFVNMSSDKEQEYFSDGLSEELLNLLARVPELRVAARTSSFYFKGKDVKLLDVARELQVAHLLEGSVRKSGSRVRITAQLIRASDGFHQWSETYDRTLDDIFAVQEEIATAVVSQLKVKLLGSPPQVRKTDPKAYALYLQALQLDRQGTDRFDESIALYEKVLAIDPNYAPAWFGLGANYALRADVGLGPVADGMEKAREMMMKALAIDPKYGLARAGLGWLALAYDHDLAAAARHYERALALNPTDPFTLGMASGLNQALGRLETEVPLGEYLVSRDPMDPANHFNLGFVYLYAGRVEESIASYRAALKLSPEMVGLHTAIGDTLLVKGDYAAALTEYKSEPLAPARLSGLAMAYHKLGQKAKSDAALDELIQRHPDWANLIGAVFAYRGERDSAFEWLHKAVVNRDSGLANAPKSLWLRNLHHDPRWLPFLRKIGKAPEQLAAIKFELRVPEH